MRHLEQRVSGMEAALSDAGLLPLVDFRDGSRQDLPIGIKIKAPIEVGEGAEKRTVRTVVAQIDFADKKGTPKSSWEVFYYHPDYVGIVRGVISSFREDHIPLVERQDALYQ